MAPSKRHRPPRKKRASGKPRLLAPGMCANCGCDERHARLWRTNLDVETASTNRKLCNSCGLYFNEHKQHRPQHLWCRSRRARSASAAASVSSAATAGSSSTSCRSGNSSSCESSGPSTPRMSASSSSARLGELCLPGPGSGSTFATAESWRFGSHPGRGGYHTSHSGTQGSDVEEDAGLLDQEDVNAAEALVRLFFDMESVRPPKSDPPSARKPHFRSKSVVSQTSGAINLRKCNTSDITSGTPSQLGCAPTKPASNQVYEASYSGLIANQKTDGVVHLSAVTVQET